MYNFDGCKEKIRKNRLENLRTVSGVKVFFSRIVHRKGFFLQKKGFAYVNIDPAGPSFMMLKMGRKLDWILKQGVKISFLL